MRQSLYIGSTPGAEDCACVGRDDYHENARRECRAFIHQLRRLNGPEPHGARLYVASNPHDFGSYLSVNCEFDEEDEAQLDYAYRCEGDGFPERWDDAARTELGLGDAPAEVADYPFAAEAGEAADVH